MERWVVVAALLLLAAQVLSQNINSQAGVISISSGNSCDSVSSDVLQCGDQGTASIAEIVAVPGEVLEFTFFALLPRRVSGGTGADCINVEKLPDGFEVPEGNCLVGKSLTARIEVSPVTMGYNLNAVTLPVPHAYTSHHTKAYKRIESQATPGVCEGYSEFFTGAGTNCDETKLFYPGSVRVESDIAGGFNSITNMKHLTGSLETWGKDDNIDDNLKSACNEVRYPPNGADSYLYSGVDLTDNPYYQVDPQATGIYFFDSPLVSATYADGDTCGSTYTCAKSSAGSKSRSCACPMLNYDELDETYGPSRTVQCSECAPYFGEYLGKATWLMKETSPCDTISNPDSNISNFGDDDDDDDSCGSASHDDVNDDCEDDDEEGFGGACDESECEPLFPTLEAYLKAVQGTCNVDPDNGDIEPKCQDDQFKTDLNIESKMQGRRFFCPNYENGHDDDNEAGGEFAFSCKSSKTSCAAQQRSYCGHTCKNTFMQGLLIGEAGKTPPQGRMWAGTAQVMESVYKCIDDGGTVDEANAPYGTRRRNTGVLYQGCIADCNAGKKCDVGGVNCRTDEGCDVFEHCLTGRPPLYDDCSGSDDDGYRRSVVNGPERIFKHMPMIPGCNPLRGYQPNAGDAWGSNTPKNIRKLPQDDDSFCSIDDEECVSATGIGDVTPFSSSSMQGGVFVARCPACACVPEFDDQPVEGGQEFFPSLQDVVDDINGGGGDGAIYQSNLCPAEGFADDEESLKERCNIPFPLYEDDDDTNSDGMHPDNPVDYIQFPFSTCAYGPKDRRGFRSVDHETYTHETGVRMRDHDTAEALGILMPYCQLYDIEPRPLPYYFVNATIIDNSPTDMIPTESLIVTPFETAIGTGVEAVNSLGNILIRIDDILSASGTTIGTNLEGAISICNATAGGQPGPPDVYNMARATPASQFEQSSDPVQAAADKKEFFKGLQNPWPEIRTNNGSIFWQGQSVDLPLQFGQARYTPVANFRLPGLLPMSEILFGLPGVAGNEEEPRRSWWYYINALERQRYGNNCGQIGIDARFFGNDANAAAACAGNRHRCVPGFLEGEDFTLQQWHYDSDITSDNPKQRTQENEVTSGNGGLYERNIIYNRLTEHTPCVVSGMYMDLLETTSCKEFLELAARGGHLPPNWTELLDEDGPCGDVRYWIQDGKLFFEDPQVRDDPSIAAELNLVVADSFLTEAGLQVSSGAIQTQPPPVCVAATESSNGHIGVFVKNTGTYEASYELTANCSAGVVSSGQATETLAPSETKEFDIVLSQTGPTQLGTFTCTLVLGTPAVPGLELQTVDLENCQLISTTDNPVFVPDRGTSDACADYGIDCISEASGADTISNEDKDILSSILLTIAILGVLLTYVLFLWLNRQAVKQYSKQKSAEVIYQESQETLSEQEGQKELVREALADQ